MLSCKDFHSITKILAQAAPLVDSSNDRDEPFNNLVSWDYALVNSDELIPKLQQQLWQQNLDEKGEKPHIISIYLMFSILSIELTVVLIQLLQVNMMKILLILDMMIMLCLFFACIYRNGDMSYKSANVV